MKLILALSALVTLSAAEPTCEGCVAVVNAAAAYLTSEESIAAQIEILLADVCPQVDNTEECVAELPNFWTEIAMLLWPGYYNPEEDFMCADLCSLTK